MTHPRRLYVCERESHFSDSSLVSVFSSNPCNSISISISPKFTHKNLTFSSQIQQQKIHNFSLWFSLFSSCSFTVIFFSTTNSQNGNRKSKLSFSSSDSHFCVSFCFYSDSDWFLWRSDSTSLAEFAGLIFDFGVLWRRSTSFSGKKAVIFFSLFIV